MMKNVDSVIIINREIDEVSGNEKTYLGFKLEKFRGKPNKDAIYVFLHPFDEINGILLTPDVDTKPLSKLSIDDFNPMNKDNGQVKYESDLQNEFMPSYIDMIDEDYTDSAKNYLDIYKQAESLAGKMSNMHNHDRDKKTKYIEDLTTYYLGLNDTNKGKIVIASRSRKHRIRPRVKNIVG
jgi:hypothetical protein